MNILEYTRSWRQILERYSVLVSGQMVIKGEIEAEEREDFDT